MSVISTARPNAFTGGHKGDFPQKGWGQRPWVFGDDGTAGGSQQ